MKLVPNSIRLESSQIIAEVANDLHDSTRAIPNRDDIDSVNNWLRPLPAILLETVQAKVTFDQIELKSDDILEHPASYEKLFLHLDNLDRNPHLLKTAIDADNKEAYRAILQWLGGYLVQKVDPGIWYRELVRRALAAESRGCELCIIGGLRFPTDALIIRKAGGIIIKIYRPGHLQYDMSDPTERERDSIVTDTVVASNGTLEDLKKCVEEILSDIRSNSLKLAYYTK